MVVTEPFEQIESQGGAVEKRHEIKELIHCIQDNKGPNMHALSLLCDTLTGWDEHNENPEVSAFRGIRDQR